MRFSVTLTLLALCVALCVVQSAPTLSTSVRRRGFGGSRSSRSRGSSRARRAAAKGGKMGAKSALKKAKKGSDINNLINSINEEEEHAHENALPSEEDVLACFPARSRVQVNGRSVRMDQLRVGDTVRTGPARASEIFMFSHAVNRGIFEFVQLRTEHGELTASPGHFVHTGRGTFAARQVVLGDFLNLANGSLVKVTGVQRIFEEGLYNPQTIDGDIVVDGFVVSTFTQLCRFRLQLRC